MGSDLRFHCLLLRVTTSNRDLRINPLTLQALFPYLQSDEVIGFRLF